MESLSGNRSGSDEKNQKRLFLSGTGGKSGRSSAPVLTKEFMHDNREEQLDQIDQMIKYFKTSVGQAPEKLSSKTVLKTGMEKRREDGQKSEDYLEQKEEPMKVAGVSNVEEDELLKAFDKKKLIEHYEKLEDELKRKRLELEHSLAEKASTAKSNPEPLKTLLNPQSDGSPKRTKLPEQEAYHSDFDSAKKENSISSKPFTYGILNNAMHKASTPQKKLFVGSIKLTDEDFKRSPSSVMMSSARRALRDDFVGSPEKGYSSESRLNTPKSRVMNLYQTSVERQERLKAKRMEKEFEKQQISNSVKTTRRSQQIFLKKLESKIYEFIEELEKTKGLLNFEGIYVLLHKLGIFHARDEAIKQAEINFLCDFWKLLLLDPEAEGRFSSKKISIINPADDSEDGMRVIPEGEDEEEDNEIGDPQVNSKLVFEVLILLLETKISVREATGVIRERVSLDFFDNNMEDMKQEEIIDYLKNAWENLKVDKIVSDFRRLFEDKRYFKESIYKGSPTSAGGKAYKSSGSGKENPATLFKPAINPKSREIDKNLNENYILKVINNGLVQNYNEGNTNQIGTKYSFREHVPQPSVHMLQTASILDKSRHELLYEHSKYLQEKKDAEVRMKNQAELNKCTFVPAINSGALNLHWVREDYDDEHGQIIRTDDDSSVMPVYEKLYDLHRKKIHEKKEAAQMLCKMKENEEISECTFQPHLYVPRMEKKRDDQPVKGMNQVIERLTKGREKQQELKKKIEDLGKIKNPSAGIKTTVVKPFSFCKNNTTLNTNQNASNLGTQANEESVFVDVAFAPGKKARIVIKKNERPEKVVKNFAKIFSLNETMQENLIETLYSILGMVK